MTYDQAPAYLQILSILAGIGVVYIFMKIPTIIKYMFNKIFPNHTKELLQKYLFFRDLVENLSSTDEFKNKLKKHKSKKIYKTKSHHFYIIKEEANAFNIDVEELIIKEVLEDELYPLLLLKSLERISIYEKEDLRYIPRNSTLIWSEVFGINLHFVLSNDTIIYPKSYAKDNEYRYGYMVVHNQDGLRGLYDIDQDKLMLESKYKYLTSISNIIEYSSDLVEYVLYDVKSKEILATNYKPQFYDLPPSTKSKIDLSKIKLQDYKYLLPKMTTKDDLVKYGLWGLDVGVLEIPDKFKDLIKNSSGTIGYNYPISADIFDMSIELPINFKKSNGEYVSLGIKFEDIVLTKSSREKLKSIKLDNIDQSPIKETKMTKPNWLKIKNKEFDNIDLSVNMLDMITNLSSDEFNELVSLLQKDESLIMLLTYLKTLDKIDLAEFYLYLEDVVKLDSNIQSASAKEQFEDVLENIDKSDITIKQVKRAYLELPMMIRFAKNIYHQATNFKNMIQAKYYPYKEDDSAVRYEGTLFKVIYSEPMKFIPDSFNQVLLHFSDYYDENNEEHKKIGTHLAKRFGLLTNALYQIQKAQDEKCDGLAWFLYTFNDEIKELDGYETLQDDKLIFYMTNTFSAILLENDDAYITSMIDVVNELMNYYPFLDDAFLYALQELMKSVALKEMNVDNTNRFLDIFINIPKLYNNLSYNKIMELKEMINTILANDKPQDNKIFEDDKVKSKVILLNYLIDMEDL